MGSTTGWSQDGESLTVVSCPDVSHGVNLSGFHESVVGGVLCF